jgi:hypothetical protein
LYTEPDQARCVRCDRQTPTSEQFLAVLAYVAADDPAAARRLRELAGESLFRLADYPESDQVLPALRRERAARESSAVR